jgi:hypothetical protein
MTDNKDIDGLLDNAFEEMKLSGSKNVPASSNAAVGDDVTQIMQEFIYSGQDNQESSTRIQKSLNKLLKMVPAITSPPYLCRQTKNIWH